MTPQDVLDEIAYVLRFTQHPQIRQALTRAADTIRTLSEERNS